MRASPHHAYDAAGNNQPAYSPDDRRGRHDGPVPWDGGPQLPQQAQPFATCRHASGVVGSTRSRPPGWRQPRPTALMANTREAQAQGGGIREPRPVGCLVTDSSSKASSRTQAALDTEGSALVAALGLGSYSTPAAVASTVSLLRRSHTAKKVATAVKAQEPASTIPKLHKASTVACACSSVEYRSMSGSSIRYHPAVARHLLPSWPRWFNGIPRVSLKEDCLPSPSTHSFQKPTPESPPAEGWGEGEPEAAKANSLYKRKTPPECPSSMSAMAIRDWGNRASRFSGCGGAREHGRGACSIR